MSLRTRINGLTAWVNLRLRPFDQLMNNVVMDLLTGTNMKMLLQSMTGRDLKKMKNLDGWVTPIFLGQTFYGFTDPPTLSLKKNAIFFNFIGEKY